MRHGSLFSGIGGFDLAAQWMGWENVFQVEKDSFCQKVLEKNFPGTARYGDIKEFDGTKYRGTVDVLTGGFPCQPFSKAGKRKGKDDDRYLWPEMLRVIKEVSPVWVIGENVPGVAKRALQEIKTSLEDSGYHTITFNIPASAVGALSNRDRIWIIGCKEDAYVANANSLRSHRTEEYDRCIELRHKQSGISESVVSEGIRNCTDPRVFRSIERIPNRVDRIKALGNAIVPQVAYEIFKAIEAIK